ncbi:MAG: hypothetical protein K2O60_04080 [Ruminococcus sp.]|nr:hypothetical protein [Ruminococcus sp.]
MKSESVVLLGFLTMFSCGLYTGIAVENNLLHIFFFANIFMAFISIIFFSMKLQKYRIMKTVRTIAGIYFLLITVSAVACIFIYGWQNPHIFNH